MSTSPEAVRRRREIEDPTNLLVVHPISNRLVPILARLGVAPNAVSLTGMGFGLAAGVAYRFSDHPVFAVLGLLLMGGWHVMDGVDGQLARLTGRHSPLGKVLDGVCDYVTFGAVYLGLALLMAGRMGPAAFAVAAVSAAAHALQSAIYEAQRADWERGGAGPPPAGGRGLVRALLGVYARMQGLGAGSAAAAGASHPPAPESYRAVFAPAVRRWSVMSANWRTILIFVFAVAGIPLGFFLVEIFALTALTLLLLVDRGRRLRRFALHPAG